MRYLIALLILIAGTAGGLLAYQRLTAGPAVVLPSPRQLQVSAGGTVLLPGGWSNSSSLALGAKMPSRLMAGLDVEVRRLGTAFRGTPTQSTGDPKEVAANCGTANNCAIGRPGAPVQLSVPDGAYHWQMRYHNQDGISPWVIYRGTVRIDTRPPSSPAISSSTDPDPKRVYHSANLKFAWQASDVGAGIAGYSYLLDTTPTTAARTELRTADPTVALAGLNTGAYYFHVRALDQAGNWGPTATFPVHLDVTPPGLAHVRFNQFQFDPQFDGLHVSFAVTRPATTVRIGVYRQRDQKEIRIYSLKGLTRGQATTVVWDGKDGSGRLVPTDSYEVYIRAIDRYGHSSLTGWRDFVVDYHHIVVSLNQQKLWAYDGNRLFLSSLVTTGNRALPTPTGTFHILAEFHPFTFHSPWPKSSPFYYKPSLTQFAMLFQAGGYFIHDAPWRSTFGPGTNGQVGTPGSNYTGTHGCINVPPNIAQQLYSWVKVGTIVQVIN